MIPNSGPMTYSRYRHLAIRYRHLAIERVRPTPTDSQLAAIETLLGANLPASFRDFLLVANGGCSRHGGGAARASRTMVRADD